MHSDYGGSFVFGVTGHQKPFLIALRFAARKPFDSLLCSSSRGQALRRKEKGFFLPYPAFTSQRVRKTAPTLTRPFASLKGRLCWATFGRPFRGWFIVAWTIDSHF